MSRHCLSSAVRAKPSPRGAGRGRGRTAPRAGASEARGAGHRRRSRPTPAAAQRGPHAPIRLPARARSHGRPPTATAVDEARRPATTAPKQQDDAPGPPPTKRPLSVGQRPTEVVPGAPGPKHRRPAPARRASAPRPTAHSSGRPARAPPCADAPRPHPTRRPARPPARPFAPVPGPPRPLARSPRAAPLLESDPPCPPSVASVVRFSLLRLSCLLSSLFFLPQDPFHLSILIPSPSHTTNPNPPLVLSFPVFLTTPPRRCGGVVRNRAACGERKRKDPTPSKLGRWWCGRATRP